MNYELFKVYAILKKASNYIINAGWEPVGSKCIALVGLLLLLFANVYGQTTNKKLRSEDYFTVRNGLNNFNRRVADFKTATVSFLGGSITYNSGWREKVCTYLQERFPGIQFRFINAGIPSLGSLPHAFRLQRDLLDAGKTDLLFVEAAVNDEANGTDSLTQIRSLEGIIRHAKDVNPLTDIIMMSFADPAKSLGYDKHIIPVTIINHELVADRYRLASVNLAKEIHDRITNKEFSWEKDFVDLHPSPFGQQLYFNTIRVLMESCLNKKAGPVQSSKLLPPLLDKARFENGRYVAVTTAVYDTCWVLHKNWEPTDSLSTREGFVHVPVLQATQPGATLSFSFSGTATGLAIIAGPDAGMIEVAIDGGPAKKIDLFTEWSSMLHLPWYLLLASDLSKTTHRLKIKISTEHNSRSNGYSCSIVHFLVNE